MSKSDSEAIKYRVHDMAAAFPLPSPEEYAAIKESIGAQGFIYPIVFWKDAKGDTWLIDGRTRDRVATEFAKAGMDKAGNGATLKPRTVYYDGSEADAVLYIEALNQSRRSMDSGQKAAAAVLSGALYRQYKAKEDGTDLTEQEAESAGDMATRVAKKAGTNRAYVFDCAKLHREHPDLLQAVLAGTYSIPEAKKVSGRRAQGLPDKPPEGGEEPIEVTPESGPDVILDGLKNEVAAELVPIFKFRLAVKDARKAVNKALEDIKSECEGIGAKNVSFQTIKADANNFVRHLEDHQPHAPCPYCSGTGKAGDVDNPNKRCGHCNGRRFMDKIQWNQCPPELRALFEKKGDAPAEGGEDYGT